MISSIRRTSILRHFGVYEILEIPDNKAMKIERLRIVILQELEKKDVDPNSVAKFLGSIIAALPVYLDPRARALCRVVSGWTKKRTVRRLMTFKNKVEDLKTRLALLASTIKHLSRREFSAASMPPLPAVIVYVCARKKSGKIFFSVAAVDVHCANGGIAAKLLQGTSGVVNCDEDSKEADGGRTCKARIQCLSLWTAASHFRDDRRCIVMHACGFAPNETLRENKNDAPLMWAIAMRSAEHTIRMTTG